MSIRELAILGTAAQVPTRNRNHSAALLRYAGDGFLIDAGEGTQRQFVRAGISITTINRILITHFHGDHVLGLPGVVQRLSLENCPHPIEIYYPASGQRFYDALLGSSIYQRKVDLLPIPVPRRGGVMLDTKDYRIEAIPVSHRVDCLNYRISTPDGRRFLPERLAELGIKGPAVGKLQREGSLEVGGRTVRVEDVTVHRPGTIYGHLTDTKLVDACFEVARDADVLTCEATYLDGDAEMAREHGHLTAGEAARIAKEAGARRLVLTHFSQRYNDWREFRDEAEAVFPDVHVARDLDVIQFPPRRGAEGEEDDGK